MITEIGTLVTIIKTLLEAAKTGSELFKKKDIVLPTDQLKQRIAGIAQQLYQSVTLSKMLPIWLKDHAEVDLFTNQLNEDDVRLLDSKLRRLIMDSIHDHFSGTFFRTSFSTLPGVDSMITLFQQRLLDLEQQLNGIPAGNTQAWRHAWPILKMRMQDLRIEAVKLNNHADKLHSDLVTELQQAGL